MKKKLIFFISKWLKLAAKNRCANLSARANLTAPTVDQASGIQSDGWLVVISTVVVESDDRPGTCHTVRWLARQNVYRTVYRARLPINV